MILHMELLEFEESRRLTREEAATWLHRLADSLARHNEVEFTIKGLRHRVAVSDEIEMEVEIEIEIENHGTKLEIELTW